MRIVLLPGLDGTGDLFDEFTRETPAGFETEVVSYPDSEPMSYDDCVGYVEALLPRSSPYVVLGESFSGPVAIALAALAPPGLQGIVLCNTFACSPAWAGFKHLPWRLAFSIPMPRYKVGFYLVGFRNSARWVKPIRDANRRVKPEVHAKRMREVLSVDVRDALSSLQVPVLYIRGTQDRLVWERSLTQIVETRSDVAVARIDAPHLTLQIAPQESWSAISNFVLEKFAI